MLLSFINRWRHGNMNTCCSNFLYCYGVEKHSHIRIVDSIIHHRQQTLLYTFCLIFRSERLENRVRGLLKKPRLVSKVPAPLRCGLKQPGRACGRPGGKNSVPSAVVRLVALPAPPHGTPSLSAWAPVGRRPPNRNAPGVRVPATLRRPLFWPTISPRGVRSPLGESARSSENPLTPPLTPRRVRLLLGESAHASAHSSESPSASAIAVLGPISLGAADKTTRRPPDQAGSTNVDDRTKPNRSPGCVKLRPLRCPSRIAAVRPNSKSLRPAGRLSRRLSPRLA